MVADLCILLDVECLDGSTRGGVVFSSLVLTCLSHITYTFSGSPYSFGLKPKNRQIDTFVFFLLMKVDILPAGVKGMATWVITYSFTRMLACCYFFYLTL